MNSRPKAYESSALPLSYPAVVVALGVRENSSEFECESQELNLLFSREKDKKSSRRLFGARWELCFARFSAGSRGEKWPPRQRCFGMGELVFFVFLYRPANGLVDDDFFIGTQDVGEFLGQCISINQAAHDGGHAFGGCVQVDILVG